MPSVGTNPSRPELGGKVPPIVELFGASRRRVRGRRGDRPDADDFIQAATHLVFLIDPHDPLFVTLTLRVDLD